MSDLVLQLKQINKYFGRSHVIKDVNIDFEKGHFVTFLGPSGCGKTTLLRMVAGFYEPDDGEILLNGKRIERIPPYSRNTAMVFQEYALFPHMNVFDNVSYGLRVKNRPKEEIERRVKEALDLMQLKGMEDRFPNQMSGGQQQRVAVARALVMNPEVLLLDEPLSNLDAKLRESVRVELRDIQKKMGLSTIYVTHDQSEALSMSDMIVVLKGGVVHQTGSPQEIYFEPKTPFVADFIGESNIIDGIMRADGVVEIFNRRFQCLDKGFAKDEPVHVVIRPEDVDIVPEGQGQLKGTVTSVTFKGMQYDIIVDFRGFKWLIQTTDHSPVGARIGIKIDPDGIHIMKKSQYSGMFGDYSSFSEEYEEMSDANWEADEEESEDEK